MKLREAAKHGCENGDDHAGGKVKLDHGDFGVVETGREGDALSRAGEG